MKKLVISLIAFVAATSFASAQVERDFRSMSQLTSQLERITTYLEENGDTIAEGKRAALEHRASLLELQIQVREAVRTAIAELDDTATKEEMKEVVRSVRSQYKDQFEALKEERRALREERRANRDEAEEEVDDSTPEG